MSSGMISQLREITSLLILLGMLGLSGCSNENLPELYIESVSIYTEPDTNQNSATAVDLVIIYDEELVKILGRMSAAQYFASSKQLLLDNPSLLDIWHWELVPGQIVQDFSPPQEEGDSYAAYVFANYLTPGSHRIKVSPHGIVKVLLMKNDLKNLAEYELHEARTGTTMSDVASEIEEPEEEYKIKLGPINELPRPCKVPPPHPIQNPNEQCWAGPPKNYIPRKPIPIVTRPLNPPPVLRNPYRK